MKKVKQSGVTLLETVLVLAIIAILALGIIMLVSRQTKNIRNVATAKQMSEVLNASKFYVLKNFETIAKDLSTAPSVVVTDAAGSSINVATMQLQLQSLKDDAFLSQSFNSQTPWGGKLVIGVAQIGLSNVLQIMVLNVNNDASGNSLAPMMEQNNIASNIENGAGAVLYSAGNVLNSCSGGTSCIKSIDGLWEIKDPDLIYSVLGSVFPSTTSASAVAITEVSADTNDAVFRYPVGAKKEKNTLYSSSLNFEAPVIDKATGERKVGIFFNALKKEDVDGDGQVDFSGAALTYRSKANEKSVISVENVNSDAGGGLSKNPFFLSQGGLVTSKEASVGAPCNFDSSSLVSDFGVIAIDATSKHMLKCIFNNTTGTSFWKEIGDIDIINQDVIPSKNMFSISSSDTGITRDLFLGYAAGVPQSATAVLLEIEYSVRPLKAGYGNFLSFEDPFSGNLIGAISISSPVDVSTQTVITARGLYPIKDSVVYIKANRFAWQNANYSIKVLGYVK